MSRRKLAMFAALLALGWLLVDKAQSQALPELEMILDCGTLRGNGNAIIRLYGRTFALLRIDCQAV